MKQNRNSSDSPKTPKSEFKPKIKTEINSFGNGGMKKTLTTVLHSKFVVVQQRIENLPFTSFSLLIE